MQPTIGKDVHLQCTAECNFKEIPKLGHEHAANISKAVHVQCTRISQSWDMSTQCKLIIMSHLEVLVGG